MVAGGLVFLGFCLVLAALIVMSVRIYQVRPDFVIKILKYSLIAMLALIISVMAVAIGFRISERHSKSYSKNLRSVNEIWGGSIVQYPPAFTYQSLQREQFEDKKTGQLKTRDRLVDLDMGFESQKCIIDVKKSIRKKGLLTFPGYLVKFSGEYEIRNFHNKGRDFRFYFQLPQGAGNITDISVNMNGKPYKGDTNYADGLHWSGYIQPGEKKILTIAYTAQGTGKFNYELGRRKVEIKKLDVVLTTDFQDSRIPEGAMVPASETGTDVLTKYEWKSENLVTGQNIALDFKIKGNYGKIVSRMFFYSPLAVFLFMGFLVIFTVARQIRLHPMHYLFIITAFFIFYLLGSYMISYMNVILAIFLSLAVSTSILLYYCYLIKGKGELLTGILFGTVIFQWIFSVSFFFPEHTGFMVTVASVVAFIALIRATATIDWENKW